MNRAGQDDLFLQNPLEMDPSCVEIVKVEDFKICEARSSANFVLLAILVPKVENPAATNV